MRIRTANREDIPALLPLAQGLIEVEQHLNTSVLTEALAGTAWVRKAEPDFGCLLAEESNGTLVGMSSYYILHSPRTPDDGPTLHVNGVFVVPTSRRRRIGTQLMHALACEASRRGCGPMVWHVPDGDPVASQFSSRLGARAIEDPLVFSLPRKAVRWMAAVLAESG